MAGVKTCDLPFPKRTLYHWAIGASPTSYRDWEEKSRGKMLGRIILDETSSG